MGMIRNQPSYGKGEPLPFRLLRRSKFLARAKNGIRPRSPPRSPGRRKTSAKGGIWANDLTTNARIETAAGPADRGVKSGGGLSDVFHGRAVMKS
jgi:hypothetical protein